MTQELVRVPPTTTGNESGSRSPADDRHGWRGFLHANAISKHLPKFPPTLLSLAGIGAVTAVLLLLDQALAFSLVPIIYLIPGF